MEPCVPFRAARALDSFSKFLLSSIPCYLSTSSDGSASSSGSVPVCSVYIAFLSAAFSTAASSGASGCAVALRVASTTSTGGSSRLADQIKSTSSLDRPYI